MRGMSTPSSITFLDGEKGILRYRGYPIEVLAEKCDFVEVSYLLIYGKLPTLDELNRFRKSLSHHTMIHEDMRSFYGGFPRDAHPMATLGSVVGALSTFYQDSLDVRDPRQVEVSVHRLMAKLPTIAAYSYKKSIGQPLIYPRNDLSYCENFLQMMFAVPCEEYRIDPDFAEALDMLLIVHADHEQNCSTSTVRMGGIQRCQPVCEYFRRHLRTLGPAARRCQSGLRGDARKNRRRWRQRKKVCRTGKEKRLRPQAHGLWAPGL